MRKELPLDRYTPPNVETCRAVMFAASCQGNLPSMPPAARHCSDTTTAASGELEGRYGTFGPLLESAARYTQRALCRLTITG